MADYRMIVLCNALPGREAEFDDWYDGRHLDDVLAVPGFHRAQRFRTQAAIPGVTPRFAHATVYDFVSDDLDRTMGWFLTAGGTERMPISAAMDPDAEIHVCRASGPPRVRDVPAAWPDDG